jgi:hypothetical protein
VLLLLATPVDRPVPTADRDRPGVAEAVEGLLGRLGGGPEWSGIAPDAPPR